MPWGLKRFHEFGQSHFVTFCFYHRPPGAPGSGMGKEVKIWAIRGPALKLFGELALK